MAFLKFILYIVIFFGVSTITQIICVWLRRAHGLEISWLGPILGILTILIWMFSPGHWFVILIFAITVGVAIAEKDKATRKKQY